MQGLLEGELYKHLMIDIESLGLVAGSVVLSAAGLWFDPYTGNFAKAFDINLSVEEQLAAGYTIDGDTAKWWFERPLDLFLSMAERRKDTLTLEAADYAILEHTKRAEHIWAMGPDFDFTLLPHALKTAKWPFWKNRDVRTMRMFVSEARQHEIAELYKDKVHDPMVDCEKQVAIVTAAYKEIGSRK